MYALVFLFISIHGSVETIEITQVLTDLLYTNYILYNNKNIYFHIFIAVVSLSFFTK